MTNLKNELPIAVHMASGGDARVRCGGTTISLDGVSAGSFQVTNGTRYRVFVDTRSTAGLLVLFGYASPVAFANASLFGLDLGEVHDDVPENTTVYFTLINPSDLQPIEGDTLDYLHVSYYG